MNCFIFLSGSLFFTPYTPFLKDNGVSDSDVFLAYTVLHSSKVFFLPFNHQVIVKGKGEKNMAKWSYLPRMLGIALVLLASLFVAGSPSFLLMTTFVAFSAVDVAFSIWNTTTTSSLMSIAQENEKKGGSLMGINSSVVGIGLLIGSIVAGESTTAFGYNTTFVFAIATLFISFMILARFFKKEKTLPSMMALKRSTDHINQVS